MTAASQFMGPPTLPDAASTNAAALQRLAEFADVLPELLAQAGVKKAGKR